MRALSLKEKSLSASSIQVAMEIKKTKAELSAIQSQKLNFIDKLNSIFKQSRNSQLSSPEIMQSLINLKRRISHESKKIDLSNIKLNHLHSKFETINIQTKKISDKINILSNAEKDKKENLEIDSLHEIKGIIRDVPESILRAVNSSRAEVGISHKASEIVQAAPKEISVSLTRADGAPALLHVALEPLGEISATVQTSISSQSDREDLERRMKKAVADHSDESKIIITVEED